MSCSVVKARTNGAINFATISVAVFVRTQSGPMSCSVVKARTNGAINFATISGRPLSSMLPEMCP
jgi:hypothetical protein